MLIDDVNQLDSEMRSKIESWLNRYSFIPRITRIDEVDVRFGYQQWKVQTDRGPADFRVQEREDIRFLNDGRFSVKDADGNVYEMTRLDQLDPHSRGQLESSLISNIGEPNRLASPLAALQQFLNPRKPATDSISCHLSITKALIITYRIKSPFTRP